jgi:hypothetical protein
MEDGGSTTDSKEGDVAGRVIGASQCVMKQHCMGVLHLAGGEYSACIVYYERAFRVLEVTGRGPLSLRIQG